MSELDRPDDSGDVAHGGGAEVIGAELPEDTLQGLMAEQHRDAEEYGRRFLKEVIRLRGVRVDRGRFLKAELHKRGLGASEIEQAIASTPVAAGIGIETLDEIALASIRFETRKSSAMSFAAGLPGGFAMLGTVPADITQF